MQELDLKLVNKTILMRLSSIYTKYFRFVLRYIVPCFVFLFCIHLVYIKQSEQMAFILISFSVLYIFLIIPKFGNICEVFAFETHIKILTSTKESQVLKTDIASLIRTGKSFYTINLKNKNKLYFFSSLNPFDGEDNEVLVRNNIR